LVFIDSSETEVNRRKGIFGRARSGLRLWRYWPRACSWRKQRRLRRGHQEIACPASVIGQMASQSGVKILVLSHFMARSLKDLDNKLMKIRLQFQGKIILADGLQCIQAGQNPG